MLFRSTGWLCTATICQALAHTADGQVGAPSPSPTAMLPVSEADAWKVVEAPAAEQQAPTFEPQPQPESPEMNPEQEPGWTTSKSAARIEKRTLSIFCRLGSFSDLGITSRRRLTSSPLNMFRVSPSLITTAISTRWNSTCDSMGNTPSAGLSSVVILSMISWLGRTGILGRA
jgi:hypothetical protein